MIGSTTTTRIILNDVPLRNNLRASSGVVTFTRASTAWAEDDAGVVQTYLTDVPRISPSKGLLIEEARTNISLWSEEFNNAWWILYAGGSTLPVVTTNDPATVAPDGTNTAEKIDFGAIVSDGDRSIVYSVTAPANTHANSIYLKAVSGSATVYFSSQDGTNYNTVRCECSSSWQRFNLPASQATYVSTVLGHDTADPGQPKTQAAASVYVWVAQREIGTSVTTPIITDATPVERKVEVNSFTIPGSAKEGTLELKFTPNTSQASWTPGGNLTLFDGCQAGGEDGVLLYFEDFRDGILSFYFRTLSPAGTTVVTTSALTWNVGQTYSIRCTWSRGRIYGYRDGVLVASLLTGAGFMPNTWATSVKPSIGTSVGTTWQANGYISDVRIKRI